MGQSSQSVESFTFSVAPTIPASGPNLFQTRVEAMKVQNLSVDIQSHVPCDVKKSVLLHCCGVMLCYVVLCYVVLCCVSLFSVDLFVQFFVLMFILPSIGSVN